MTGARSSPPLRGVNVAVIGASGYVGRLAMPTLLAAGADLRAIVRRPTSLSGMPGLERRTGDAGHEAPLVRALSGVEVLLDVTRQEPGGTAPSAAVIAAAARTGVRHIVSLRCLGEPAGRPQTSGEAPVVTVVRTAPLLGMSSTLVITLRRLVERLPLVPVGRWAESPVQPLAASDLVRALVTLLARPELGGRDYELGGADVVTVHEMLEAVGTALGRRPVLAPIPLDLRGASALLVRAVGAPGAGGLLGSGGRGVVDPAASLAPALPLVPMGFAAGLRAALAASGPRRLR